ncbi:hypothetical protein FDP41_011841 [Naegleria fowleri]|uniref:Uncharacterized protein n=1 Tax=Naegleria fowleri TaxID=5763 RepID=A0A6A5C857_NAEFO|nr:uncharacterized protein FDP41_011841 [Naegleria fowleri]KAF0981980.1 hypothetical protein FDP41_011841 [Naegleria fowleri]
MPSSLTLDDHSHAHACGNESSSSYSFGDSSSFHSLPPMYSLLSTFHNSSTFADTTSKQEQQQQQQQPIEHYADLDRALSCITPSTPCFLRLDVHGVLKELNSCDQNNFHVYPEFSSSMATTQETKGLNRNDASLLEVSSNGFSAQKSDCGVMGSSMVAMMMMMDDSIINNNNSSSLRCEDESSSLLHVRPVNNIDNYSNSGAYPTSSSYNNCPLSSSLMTTTITPHHHPILLPTIATTTMSDRSPSFNKQSLPIHQAAAEETELLLEKERSFQLPSSTPTTPNMIHLNNNNNNNDNISHVIPNRNGKKRKNSTTSTTSLSTSSSPNNNNNNNHRQSSVDSPPLSVHKNSGLTKQTKTQNKGITTTNRHKQPTRTGRRLLTETITTTASSIQHSFEFLKESSPHSHSTSASVLVASPPSLKKHASSKSTRSKSPHHAMNEDTDLKNGSLSSPTTTSLSTTTTTTTSSSSSSSSSSSTAATSHSASSTGTPSGGGSLKRNLASWTLYKEQAFVEGNSKEKSKSGNNYKFHNVSFVYVPTDQ